MGSNASMHAVVDVDIRQLTRRFEHCVRDIYHNKGSGRFKEFNKPLLKV
jgi:hypothetical protein